MELEKGDYFAITRGVKFRPISGSIFSLMNPEESWKQPKEEDKEPSYDRSWKGCVFLVKEVCTPLVAAQLIVDGGLYHPEPMYCFNLTEMEVMTVTKQFVQAMLPKEKKQ